MKGGVAYGEIVTVHVFTGLYRGTGDADDLPVLEHRGTRVDRRNRDFMPFRYGRRGDNAFFNGIAAGDLGDRDSDVVIG